MDCTCGSEERQKRRAVKIRRRYDQLRRQHRKLLGVAIELTQVLEEYVRGQRKPNVSETLSICSKIYPSLFDELSARTQKISLEASREQKEKTPLKKGCTDIQLSEQCTKKEDNEFIQRKDGKGNQDIQDLINLIETKSFREVLEPAEVEIPKKKKTSTKNPDDCRKLKRALCNGSRKVEKAEKDENKINMAGTSKENEDPGITEVLKSERRHVKKELLELAEEDYFDGFWSKKEIPRTPAKPLD